MSDNMRSKEFEPPNYYYLQEGELFLFSLPIQFQ